MKKEKKKRSSRYIANVSLAVMGAGFLATLPFEQDLALKMIQGGFEAGLVGGLADWFAVTALFRHPLNIPIPHTALLPKNREKITNSILSVVENEWLKKDSIVEKVSNIPFAQTILAKLEETLKKEQTISYIQKVMKQSICYVEKEKIKEITRVHLQEAIEKIDTKKVMTVLIDKSIEQKLDNKIFDIVFQIIERKTADKETKEKIAQFVFKTMEKKAENSLFKLALKPLVSIGKDKLSTTIEKAIDEILMDMKNENSENRANVLNYIRRELENLKTNDQIISSIEEKKKEFAKEESLDKLNDYLVDMLLTKIENMVESREFITEKVIPFLENVLLKIKQDEQTIENINTGIKNSLVEFIEQNHSKIGTLVRDNINKLKNEELIDMMENKIGKELSWIRVNGAICGFLIGIGLTVLKMIV